eukprot:COSAG05_NODE_6216_length_997_cov_1.169265_1_plen_222_part_01
MRSFCAPLLLLLLLGLKYASGGRTVRLFTGSKFPVATRWKDSFAVNLQLFLNRTQELKDVVDVVTPSCFHICGVGDAPDPGGLFGLQMQAGCVERVRGLHAQGFRIEPLVGSTRNTTIDDTRRLLDDERFISACADAMTMLNASGLNFDFELETSNATDGARFASMLTRMRKKLRTRVANATVSADTGTGRMSKTDVLGSSSVDTLISMGTYAALRYFEPLM